MKGYSKNKRFGSNNERERQREKKKMKNERKIQIGRDKEEKLGLVVQHVNKWIR